jgi:hypothetical protein
MANLGGSKDVVTIITSKFHIVIDDNIFNFEFDENIIFSYELESHFSLVCINVQE